MKKGIEELDAAYTEAFNEGDVAGCAEVFTGDVITLVPEQPMARGKRALEDILRSMIDKTNGGTHSNKLVEYGVEGHLACQVGTYAFTGTNPPEEGKYVNILKRRADSTWKVFVSRFSTDKPR